ncbi:MAG: cupin domain-containing protein [bacterium]|nr:cupin domain-containing protein [bacterium]
MNMIDSLSKLRMPGATLITRLRVYDTPSLDGQRGGTPHVHLVCSELYYVLSGTGAVEMIDASGFSRVELEAHSALLFSPGTIHRLINPHGDLELLVTMQNSGLPERGDNVVAFVDDVMADDAAYHAAMRVTTLEEACRRRDRGVEGFLHLKAACERDPQAGREALAQFYGQAAARTAPLRREWGAVVRAGALHEAETALASLTALESGDTEYLHSAAHTLIHAAQPSKPGFCGHLNRYFDPATLNVIYTPEGTKA